MKNLRTWMSVTLLAVTVAAAGCNKKDEPKTEPAKVEPAKTEPAKVEPPKTEPVKTEPPAAPADDKSDWLKVVADHTEAGKGPVDVVFKGIKVVKADFDPAKVEGGTAELEIDLNTLESGIPKRNDHLKSADYLNTAAGPAINLKIANVKKTGDNAYSADATVKLNGTEKTYPVTFNVVETMADGIRIKGEHKFLRTDFKVGKAEGDSAKPELSATLQLTLKKT